MKVSYNWLKDYLDIDKPVDEVAEILTNLGLEVEKIEDFESIKGSLEGVIVGEVMSCKKHPNADRLKLTSIDLGDQGKFEIVCGAPNIAKGQKVPVATVGSTIYTNSGEKIKISKSKIRGVVSNGMVCAEDEIGLGDSHDGIMILDNKINYSFVSVDQIIKNYKSVADGNVDFEKAYSNFNIEPNGYNRANIWLNIINMKDEIKQAKSILSIIKAETNRLR